MMHATTLLHMTRCWEGGGGGGTKKVVSLSLSLGRLTRFDRSGGRGGGGIIWSSTTKTAFLKSGEEFVMVFCAPSPPPVSQNIHLCWVYEIFDTESSISNFSPSNM